jgi:hypothetical protein
MTKQSLSELRDEMRAVSHGERQASPLSASAHSGRVRLRATWTSCESSPGATWHGVRACPAGGPCQPVGALALAEESVALGGGDVLAGAVLPCRAGCRQPERGWDLPDAGSRADAALAGARGQRPRATFPLAELAGRVMPGCLGRTALGTGEAGQRVDRGAGIRLRVEANAALGADAPAEAGEGQPDTLLKVYQTLTRAVIRNCLPKIFQSGGMAR